MRLGWSGLKVSSIALGCMGFGNMHPLMMVVEKESSRRYSFPLETSRISVAFLENSFFFKVYVEHSENAEIVKRVMEVAQSKV